MADEGFPFPGVSTIEDVPGWETFFSASAAGGVVPGVGNELIGTLNNGTRQAIVGTGGGWLRGFYKPVSSPTGTAIPGASAADRIDRLVLRLDRAAGTEANFIKPVVIQGSSGVATPPAIQSSLAEDGKWDLTISRWTSHADGGLGGLVDERYWLGQISVFTSGARPPAAPPRPGFEKDTKRWLWSDGSTWNTIGEDTGYSNLSLIGGSGGWSQGSIPLAIARKDGVVHLTGSLAHGAKMNAETKICDLPAGTTPRKTIQFMVYQDGGDVLLMAAYASGTRSGEIWCTGNLGNHNAGAVLRVQTQWLPL